MSTRVFTGPDIKRVLAEVRAELGPDAVIVSADRAPGGLLSGPSYRVVVATDAAPPAEAASTAKDDFARLAGPDPLEKLASSLPAASGWRDALRLAEGPRRRVTALVGPTGVGKTTTIAKLAARDVFFDQRRVAMLSLDHYRVGAHEQLGKFAELIGIPFLPVSNAEAIAGVIRNSGSIDRFYLDTPGRGPRDLEAHRQLGAALAGPNTDVWLTVACATAEPELEALVERYAGLAPNALVITKKDEAASPVGIATIASFTKLPLTYITDGQRVPEDIAQADLDELRREIAAHLAGPPSRQSGRSYQAREEVSSC